MKVLLFWLRFWLIAAVISTGLTIVIVKMLRRHSDIYGLFLTGAIAGFAITLSQWWYQRQENNKPQ